MATISSRILEYLWQQTWQVAVLALVVGGLCALLRHKSPYLRYMLWLVVLVKALVPPVFTVSLPILRPSPLDDVPNVMQPMDGVPRLDGPQPITMTYPDIPVPKDPGVRVHEILTCIWLAGVAALGCLSVARATGLHRRLMRYRLPLPGDQARSIEGFMAALGLAHRPRIWLVRDVSQPFVWGLGRGHIHIPAHLMDHVSPTDLRMVLAHELCHCLRYDALINSIQVLVQTVFWFHPLVWWANSRIRTEREKCCDEMAIALLHAPARAYGTAIVNALAAEQGPGMAIPSLAIAGSLKRLEERIGDLMRRSTFRIRPSLLAMTAVLLLTLIVVPSSVVLSRQQTFVTPPSIEPLVTQLDPNAGPEASEPNREMIVIRIRVERMSQLKHIGTAISLFAIDHDETLPASLKDIQPYCDPNLYQWAQTNVEYIGKGRLDRTSKAPIAFDQEYLASEGTIVLFADGHVEYRTRPLLRVLGIIDPNIQFSIEAWGIRIPVEDQTLTQFAKDLSPEAVLVLSREESEVFRSLAESAPGAEVCLSGKVIALARLKATMERISQENFRLVDSSDPSDPCAPRLSITEIGNKLSFICTRSPSGSIFTRLNWRITDELPQSPEFPAGGLTTSEVATTISLPPSQWTVTHHDIGGWRYYLMFIASPNDL